MIGKQKRLTYSIHAPYTVTGDNVHQPTIPLILRACATMKGRTESIAVRSLPFLPLNHAPANHFNYRNHILKFLQMFAKADVLLCIDLPHGSCEISTVACRVAALFATPGKSACVARGCCWDDSSNPNCFFINNRPVSDPLTSTLVHLFEWSWSDIAKECKAPFPRVLLACDRTHLETDLNRLGRPINLRCSAF